MYAAGVGVVVSGCRCIDRSHGSHLHSGACAYTIGCYVCDNSKFLVSFNWGAFLIALSACCTRGCCNHAACSRHWHVLAVHGKANCMVLGCLALISNRMSTGMCSIGFGIPQHRCPTRLMCPKRPLIRPSVSAGWTAQSHCDCCAQPCERRSQVSGRAGCPGMRGAYARNTNSIRTGVGTASGARPRRDGRVCQLAQHQD